MQWGTALGILQLPLQFGLIYESKSESCRREHDLNGVCVHKHTFLSIITVPLSRYTLHRGDKNAVEESKRITRTVVK
jgi:hypothetical protein